MLQVEMDATITHDAFADDMQPVHAPVGRWGQRRVSSTTTDVSMASVPQAAVALADRDVHLDADIGGIRSAGISSVGQQDAELIARSLGRAYRELVAYPAQLKYLFVVRRAIECQVACGSSHLAMAEAVSKVLVWCESAEVPSIPSHLLSKLKQSHRLRLDSDRLTRQVDLKYTASNLKKAVSKNEQLTHFNRHQLRPAQLDYDRVLYALIDQQPAVHELSRRLQLLKELLPDNTDAHVPIDAAVHTWAYNILLERAKTAAGVHY